MLCEQAKRALRVMAAGKRARTGASCDRYDSCKGLRAISFSEERYGASCGGQGKRALRDRSAGNAVRLPRNGAWVAAGGRAGK